MWARYLSLLRGLGEKGFACFALAKCETGELVYQACVRRAPKAALHGMQREGKSSLSVSSLTSFPFRVGLVEGKRQHSSSESSAGLGQCSDLSAVKKKRYGLLEFGEAKCFWHGMARQDKRRFDGGALPPSSLWSWGPPASARSGGELSLKPQCFNCVVF